MFYGRAFQNASLRIIMVPAFGREYSRNVLFTTLVIACNGDPRLSSMQHLLYPLYASGRAIVCLMNAIVQFCFFIVSESDKGSWIGSERFSFFAAKTGMATLRITYLGSWT